VSIITRPHDPSSKLDLEIFMSYRCLSTLVLVTTLCAAPTLAEETKSPPLTESTTATTSCRLGASGAVEMIATILTLQRGVIHPTINYLTPDPDCDLDYVPNKARETRVRRAISNSFGFGGHNCCLVAGAM